MKVFDRLKINTILSDAADDAIHNVLTYHWADMERLIFTPVVNLFKKVGGKIDHTNTYCGEIIDDLIALKGKVDPRSAALISIYAGNSNDRVDLIISNNGSVKIVLRTHPKIDPEKDPENPISKIYHEARKLQPSMIVRAFRQGVRDCEKYLKNKKAI